MRKTKTVRAGVGFDPSPERSFGYLLRTRPVVTDDAERVGVCRLEELADGCACLVVAKGRKIALCHIGDEVFAMGDACPHRAGPLSEGRVSARRMELICPWHFFRFDVRTGKSITNPEMVNQTYPVVVEKGEVFVEIRRASKAAP
jgi:nitrite reductase/ring-hydroxylating ferredoxin subunit